MMISNELSHELSQLLTRVTNCGGVLTVTMADIRQACGYRLSEHSLPRIQEKLGEVAIGFVPRELSRDPTVKVRLYLRDSRVGKLIEMALTPKEETDERLREVANGEAQQKLDAIRAVMLR